ncbi:MAG: hypothetical protein QOI24_1849 [Acidobacteriota bacterium]|nr:hypothetical protein [Acidobacteriota bacterium]
MRAIRLQLAVLLFVVASVASATSLIVPSDRELAGRADVIVTGTIGATSARMHDDGYVFTDYRLDVDGVVKGSVTTGQSLVISEIGGTVPGRMTIVEGSATYAQGDRVLVFLRAREDGTWYTAAMTMGKFRFTRATRGEAVLVRDETTERPRLAQPFIDFLRDPRKTMVPTASAYGITPNATIFAVNPGAYCVTVGPPTLPVRWQGCDTGCTKQFRFNGTIAGLDVTGGMTRAAAAWTNDTISPASISIAGTSNATSPSGGDGENSIIYNYAAALPTGICDSNQACTVGTAVTPTHTFGGDTFYSLIDADIIFRPITFTQAQFETLMTHEFGHALGFRHSDQGTPSSSVAVMASLVNANIGASLRTWDREAIETVYGPGPACEAPAVVSTSGGGTISSGQSTTLSVVASGTTPLAYQWYDGQSGNTATPVGTNSPSYNTGPLTSPKNYWVKITNSCGNASSTTFTVTPAACNPPSITSQPLSQSIQLGATAALAVTHTGTQPFFYQWYIGASGNTASPIDGETNRTYTTPALSQTTSYWVKVVNSCGNVDSATAIVTVIGGNCTKPLFTAQPANITIQNGGRATLFASAQDATSSDWFKGAVGDTSTPVAGQASSNARYVRQLYIDLLGRPADAAAIASFGGALDASSLTRTQVATAVLVSTEYRTLLLNNFYSSLLHRPASSAEVAFWMPAFVSGLSDQQIESQILGSLEYFTLAGGTNSTWLARLYNDILGRSIDPAAEAVWTGVLAGASRSTVALQILNSPEARNRRVQQYFLAYLRRPAGTSELSTFSALLGTATDETVQAQIVAASEYIAAGTIFITDPLTETTPFWVRATNACGTTNSNAATVTIAGCAPPSIQTQPKSGTANAGDQPALTVVVSSVDPISYQWYEGATGDTSKPVSGATGAVFITPVQFTVGSVSYWVRVSTRCGAVNSSAAVLNIVCGPARKLKLTLPPTSPAQSGYRVSWDGDSRLFSKYELQESATTDFANATTFTVTGANTKAIAAHTEVTGADKRFYYRVRPFASCNGQAGVYSEIGTTLIVPTPPPNLPFYNLATQPCEGTPCPPLTQPLLIGNIPATGKGDFASDAGDTFVITVDKSYVTVTPSTGVVGATGSNVTMNVDLTKIPIGSSEATITIVTTSPAGKGALASRSTSLPVSISLVTPVSPTPKDNNPPPNTLIIPAIAHADGIGKFVSDVRITNTSAQSIEYQLAYTPTAIDGTTAGKTSLLTIEPGETKALNDIVSGWYGAGSAGEGGLGVLEIRPQNYAGKGVHASASPASPQLATIAASRTYNIAANGTFGQFIPAIPLASFLGKSDAAKISLQQVAQSAAFRTNFGFVEGSGQAVDMVLTLRNATGGVVATRPYSLKAFEHQQINMATLFPGTTLSDGRLEVAVTSDGGRVTAYASVLDNTTQDPLLVFPVDTSRVAAQRYVVPGVAELNNGAANFHTDMRIFNSGGAPVDINVAYSTSDRTPPAPVTMHLNAGEVKALDNILQSVWNISGSGGAVVVTTADSSSLVVTARTYSRRDDGGTLGQFIPGVTTTEAVGEGDRALQVIELEQSPSFRSNLGLVEVTGQPVTIEVLGYIPESKVAARTTVGLSGGQFLQLGSIFAQMGFGNVYNGRVAVNVIGGTGKVAAYGSVIDNRTQDPTYVPAQ